MLKYNPTHHKYADDANMRPDKQKNQAVIDNSKDDARGKIGRPVSENLICPTFQK